MTKKYIFDFLMNNDAENIQQNLDWYKIFSTVVSEKIEGLLFKSLIEHNLMNVVPKPIKKNLYINYKYNQEKNLLYIREFKKVQNLLFKNGIQVFPYKGLSLLDDIYSDYGVRYMEDIDILSPKIDINFLKLLLEGKNYQLCLIDEKNISMYKYGEPISSCLFIKKNTNLDLIPYIKLDISMRLPKDKNSFYYDNEKLSQEYIFYLLCKYFFNDSFDKIQHPVPEDCTLIKLIDIISFIEKHPRQTNYILKNNAFKENQFVKYTIQCINYFSKGDQL